MLRLFDSLMRNYPIQTFLFWRTRNRSNRKFMQQIAWDADLSDHYDPNISKKDIEKVFVLDGQQRLQTLYAIFLVRSHRRKTRGPKLISALRADSHLMTKA